MRAADHHVLSRYFVTKSDSRFQENPNAIIIMEIYKAISSFHCRVIFGISAKNGLLLLYCDERLGCMMHL